MVSIFEWRMHSFACWPTTWNGTCGGIWQPDARDEENAQLKSLVGNLTLRLEIHRQAEKLRAGELPFIPGKRK